jgi:hypothetical protein
LETLILVSESQEQEELQSNISEESMDSPAITISKPEEIIKNIDFLQQKRTSSNPTAIAKFQLDKNHTDRQNFEK